VIDAPLLHLQFKPRYTLFLDGEKEGQFVVNAELSQYHGKHWTNTSNNKLVFSINLVENNKILVQSSLTAGTTGNVFNFDLSLLKPSLDPIGVVLYGAPESGERAYTATSSFYYLPDKKNGSTTRLDNLNGGMVFRNTASGHKFRPLLAYGFYASYDGFLALDNATAEIQHYADLGLNAMTPLTLYRDSAAALDYMDAIDLRFMYDLRDGYQNLTFVREQVLAARDAEALFAYWSADEPDGHQDPFNGTVLARDMIRSLDPYHPVAVVLNCQDFYFAEYTAGADIIMEDVYPIGINSTWSKWGTACNKTLGDCGCDNCQGNVQDVSSRLDDLAKYERWLGLWPKTKIHNPQSFFGEGYWLRYPTPEEEYVMVLLALNHGAHSIISWVYPTGSRSTMADLLGSAHGNLSRVVTASPAVDFLIGSDRPHPVPITVWNSTVVDVAYWILGKKMLVSTVNGGYVDINGTVHVPIPKSAGISTTLWGGVQWMLSGDKLLTTTALPALGTSLLIVDLQ
jgi:hypothetical protein